MPNHPHRVPDRSRSKRTPTSIRRGSRRGPRLALRSLLGLLLSLAVPTTVLAQEGRVELVLRPVGQPGQFFDITMRPGESRVLEVELANAGDGAITARTYAADVYTIINGGFGARLRDEPQSATTLWLDFPTEVLELPAGRGIRRSFTVSVPANASTGEYITSLVLENDEPVRGGGNVALDQVMRQAVAVVITVPGSRSPGLAVGVASHKVVAERSVVAVAVENNGNVRLRPVAEFALLDATGAVISRASVPMDTFYAHTETLVEVPLAALLQPGAYRVRLTLEDAVQGVSADEVTAPFAVEAPAEPAFGEGVGPGLAEVIQGVQEGRVPLPLGIALLSGLGLVLLIGWLLVVLRRRRRSRFPGQ